MVTAGAAAVLTKQSLLAICRRIEAGQVHYDDGPEGLFICLESLVAD
jgi:hypothetical protein